MPPTLTMTSSSTFIDYGGSITVCPRTASANIPGTREQVDRTGC